MEKFREWIKTILLKGHSIKIHKKEKQDGQLTNELEEIITIDQMIVV